MKVFLLVIPFIFFATSAFAAQPGNVNRVAYLKINKNRVMIYEFTGNPTTANMASYISKNRPMKSDGRFTAVYYFKKGTKMPLSGFSSVRSLDRGNDILYDSPLVDPWNFMYMHYLNGKTELVNCLSNKTHNFCKQ